MSEAPGVAALHAAPEDEARWRVYADALLSRGDVRGALIGLSGPEAAAFREQHLAELHLEPLLALQLKQRLKVEWRFGHLDAVWLLGTQDDEPRGFTTLLHDVFTHPLAAAVRAALLVSPPDAAGEHEAQVSLLLRVAPALRRLAWHPHVGAAVRPSRLFSLPWLEQLDVAEVDSLGDVASSTLQVLRLAFRTSATPLVLGRLELSQLTGLTVETRSATAPSLGRWLAEKVYAPQLERLSVQARVDAGLLTALAEAPLAASVRRLELAALDDAGARVLLGRRAAWSQLREVQVGRATLSPAVQRALAEAFSS